MNKKYRYIGIFSLLSIMTQLYAIDIGSLINKRNCDQVIDKTYFSICYDHTFKGARYVGYHLDGQLVHKNNIEERQNFYTEKLLPKRYRSTSSDYTGTGFDRGHLASDASFDFDIKALRKTYTLANSVPMTPFVNRKIWVKAEKLERKVAYSLGEVYVLNGVIYGGRDERIGKSSLAVPYAFWKMIYSKDHSYERCFYMKNMDESELKSDRLKEYEFECSQITVR